MGSPFEGPNPLRPYYVPPSIGLAHTKAEALAQSPPSASARNITSFGSSSRNIIPDFDYSDYLSDASPSVVDSVRQFMERALWRYSSTLISQPFEVGKTILQVYVAESEEEKAQATHATLRQGESFGGYQDDEISPDSEDERNYFASAAQFARTPSTPQRQRPPHRVTDRSGYIPQASSSPKYLLKIKDTTSLFDIMGQLWTTNGPTSVWKASTSSFIYSLLLPTLNTFLRSLLSALLGVPEDILSTTPNLDILTASSPSTVLLIAGAASALSSIILSPIDTARTYLILTPQGHSPRSLLRAIQRLPAPNYLIPPHLLPITILSSTLPDFLDQGTPLFLKSYLSLDPILNPSSWSLCTFLSALLELGLRVPLETVLRRAQIATFTSPILRQQSAQRAPSSVAAGKAPVSFSRADESDEVKTVVNVPQTYRGILGTMWGIVYEEGTMPLPPESKAVEEMLQYTSGTASASTVTRRPRKGQGVRGLYRTWRVEMWGLVGIWGSGMLASLLSAGDEEMGPSAANIAGTGVRF